MHQYLVNHEWAPIFVALSLVLVGGHYINSVAHIILQQPLEGLTFVLAKLNDEPAQNEPLIRGIPALRANAGLGISLHLFWLLHRTSLSSSL